MKKTLLILICSLFVGFSSVAQLEFNIDNCEGSHMHQYSLDNRDSVRWSLESGDAEFTQGDEFLSVGSATDGTVLRQTNYYPSPVGEVFEYYTINLPEGCEIEEPEVNTDSIINILEGEWVLTSLSGGICGCVIDITNTDEAQYVQFESHPTSTDSIGYSFYSGSTLITEYSRIGYTEVGIGSTGWFLENWPNDIGGESIRYFVVNDSSLSIDPEGGLLDGMWKHYGRRNLLELNINNCDGSYYHQYGSPDPLDSLSWEVESGYADFTVVGVNELEILESTDGTVMLKHVYYNGNVTTTSYVLNLPDDCVEEEYTLEGYVRAGNPVWDYGTIYLYDISEDLIVDSVQFDNGIYLFTNVSAGTYTLYAVPYEDISLTEVATDYVTTYYVNKLNLEEANTFEITDNTFGVDLQLLEAEVTIASIDAFNNTNISAYPNPFADELIIDFDQAGAEVTVLNIQGNTIYNGPLDQSTNLNTSDWANGIYFIEVTSQNVVNTIKVIK